MANKVTLVPEKDIREATAKMKPTQDALEKHAKKIKKAAETYLAGHRKTGAHTIKYEGHSSTVNYGHIDHYVVMEGPAPVSVEYGHMTKNGKWVHGLYIMTRASLTT